MTDTTNVIPFGKPICLEPEMPAAEAQSIPAPLAQTQNNTADTQTPEETPRTKIGMRGADGKTYKLTIKQERFCHELIKSGNAATAYRLAYNCAKQKESTIRQNASTLLTNRNVLRKIDELKAAVLAKTSLSRAWVLERLMEHAEVCLGRRKIKITKAIKDQIIEIETTALDQSAGNRALELLGKEAGMFVDRREVGGPGDFARMGDDELKAFVEREMEESRKRTGTDG